jgi:hypothetical protein
VSREHPLLMRPELVRATLAGRKTQTRRLVTRANSRIVNAENANRTERQAWDEIDWSRARPAMTGPGILAPDKTGTNGWTWMIEPRVHVGDLFWIREPWQTGVGLDDWSPARIAQQALIAGYTTSWAPLRYPADGREDGRNMLGFSRFGDAWGRERRGMHMPRWACRLTLPVEAVRAERVQAISGDDVMAEGLPRDDRTYTSKAQRDGRLREAFATLWDTINGERPGASFDADPWVWVYQWPAVGGPQP